MSFNFLKYGINFKNKAKTKDTIKDEETKPQQLNTFPDCILAKRKINAIKKKIQTIKMSTEDIEKLKEKKIEIWLKKLKANETALLETLNVHSDTDIEPLCSFEEIQK